MDGRSVEIHLVVNLKRRVCDVEGEVQLHKLVLVVTFDILAHLADRAVRAVVLEAVPEHQPHVSNELLYFAVSVPLQLVSHRPEVHRLFDDLVVVGGARRLRVHRLLEDPRLVVLQQQVQHPVAGLLPVVVDSGRLVHNGNIEFWQLDVRIQKVLRQLRRLLAELLELVHRDGAVLVSVQDLQRELLRLLEVVLGLLLEFLLLYDPLLLSKFKLLLLLIHWTGSSGLYELILADALVSPSSISH